MKKYAVLNDQEIVDNIIVASSLKVAEDMTNSSCALIPLDVFVNLGYTYSNGTFSAPAEEPPAEETPA